MLNVNVTTTETVIEAVTELNGETFHVVDSNEAAAALGAEIEALLTSTMAAVTARHAHANFSRAIKDLYQLVG